MPDRTLPMLIVPIAMAVAFAATPGPAVAASGDMGCIEAKLGPAAMQRIGDGVVTIADKGADLGQALDADREALIVARDACRAANGWSADAVQAAVSYTQARATRLGAESALKVDGLDAVKLGARYAALSIADRKSLIAQASPAALGAITTATTGVAKRRHVLLYFAALAGLEFYPADFTAA